MNNTHARAHLIKTQIRYIHTPHTCVRCICCSCVACVCRKEELELKLEEVTTNLQCGIIDTREYAAQLKQAIAKDEK